MIHTGDCKNWLAEQEDNSIDLLFGSPEYELARDYDDRSKRKSGQAWVDWMVDIVKIASSKVKGLIAINCQGQTRNYSYSGVPWLLFADLKRAGFNMRNPPIFHRVGIPGSGGPDWLRGDYEPIICVTRPGRLPWSDNTACGHPPKWAPGGEMSHRVSDGTRVNQWGPIGTERGKNDNGRIAGEAATTETIRPSHVVSTKSKFGMRTDKPVGTRATGNKGEHEAFRPKRKILTRERPGTHSQESTEYDPPAIANPGNTIRQTYTADEVISLLAEASDLFHCTVGGGNMGSPLASKNEAPFPLKLAEFFVRSFCPPGGVVADPWCGSGTTGHAALLHGRRFIGCDIRESQVELTKRRLASITPLLTVST